MIWISDEACQAFELAFRRIGHEVSYNPAWDGHGAASEAFIGDTTLTFNERGLARSIGQCGQKTIVIHTLLGNVGLFLYVSGSLKKKFIIVRGPVVLVQTNLIPLGFITHTEEIINLVGGPIGLTLAESLTRLRQVFQSLEVA